MTDELEPYDRNACDAVSAALRAIQSRDLAGANAVLRQPPPEDVIRVLMRLLWGVTETLGEAEGIELLIQVLGNFGQGLPVEDCIRLMEQDGENGQQ